MLISNLLVALSFFIYLYSLVYIPRTRIMAALHIDTMFLVTKRMLAQFCSQGSKRNWGIIIFVSE